MLKVSYISVTLCGQKRKMFSPILFLFGVICLTQSAVLPVDKCKLEDSSCMIAAFQKALPIFMIGIPELDVEVLDVMEMEDVKFDLSGLQFSLSEGKLKGLKGAVVDSVKWNQKKKKMVVEFHVNAVVKGHYTAGGRILILPITGDGQITMKLKNVAIKFTIDYEMGKDADGKELVKPIKYDFEFDVKDNAHFSLTNLFNGNKELSDTMHIFLNENWKQISQEFGRPIMGAAASKIYKSISHFFKKTPIEEIAELA